MKTDVMSAKTNSFVKAVLLIGIKLTLLGLFCQSASASVVFSQLPVGGAPALISDFTNGQQEADNFKFQVPSVVPITEVRWWGSYVNENIQSDNFIIRFFEDQGGAPKINPFVNLTPMNLKRNPTSMIDDWGRTIFKYEADMPVPVPLTAGITYYFSPVNRTASGSWKWAGDGGGTHWHRSSDGVVWQVSSTNSNFAFELIPEPATVTLLGLGALSLLRRKRSV